jgi:hypothetical protein
VTVETTGAGAQAETALLPEVGRDCQQAAAADRGEMAAAETVDGEPQGPGTVLQDWEDEANSLRNYCGAAVLCLRD